MIYLNIIHLLLVPTFLYLTLMPRFPSLHRVYEAEHPSRPLGSLRALKCSLSTSSLPHWVSASTCRSGELCSLASSFTGMSGLGKQQSVAQAFGLPPWKNTSSSRDVLNSDNNKILGSEVSSMLPGPLSLKCGLWIGN